MDILLRILGSIIFALTAIFLLGFSLAMFLHRREFYRKAIRTEAIVIRSDSYAPVYEFRTNDGETITKRHGGSTYPSQYQVGQSIDVLYFPEYPSYAEIHGSGDLYKTPIFIAFFGIMAAVMAVGFVLGEVR